MATRTINANAPNTNYQSGLDWVGGIAPTTGDTAIINAAPPNGPLTATNDPITGQSIVLQNNGQFFTAGTTSFDAASTLTDQNGASNLDIQLGNGFVNNGIFVNADYIFIGTQSGQTPTPVLTNNGSLNYSTNLGGGTGFGQYLINGYNSAGNPELTNNGGINVQAAAGANYSASATILPTALTITGVVNGGGGVNIIGSAPNGTTGPAGSSATNASVEFQGAVQGTQTFNLNDAELQFDAGSTGTVNFQDGTSILDLANVTNVAESLVIRGLRTGDAIGLGTTTITRAAYDTTTTQIDLFNASNTMVSALNLQATGTQNFATATFTIVPYSQSAPSVYQQADAAIITTNSPRMQNYLVVNAAAPCYCPGTLIRTDRGDVAVERLAIGDRVITLNGTAQPIKWIGRRAFAGRFIEGRRDILPVCIRAGALGSDLPRRDLWISPLHAMYLNDVLVPASALVNDVSITQEVAVDRVEYVHIELDRHGVIWAEGAASETFVDDFSRAMFHNSHEFAALYPDEAAVPASYCAPRVESGERLAAIRRVIDMRAGIELPGAGEELKGRVDELDGLTLVGWAQNPERPEAPVCLDVFVNGAAVARTMANVFRADLLAAGLGSGCHSFRVRLPKAARTGRIEVRRVSDGAAVGALDRRRAAAA